MLIDTHTHAVSADESAYPQRATALANGAWWSEGDHSVEALIAQVRDSATTGVVLVQAAGAYGTDNRYIVDSRPSMDARRGPLGLASVAVVGPDGDPSATLTELATAGVGGIRLFHIPRPSRPWLGTDSAFAIVDEAARLGLTITICCQLGAGDAEAVGRLLQHRSDVAMVLDHCGFANFSGEPPYDKAQPLFDLERHSNLHLKFTPTLVRLCKADPVTLLRTTTERFGAHRIVWGSDWPQHRETDSYAQQVEVIASWLDALPAAERAAVAGGNALRLWPGTAASQDHGDHK